MKISPPKLSLNLLILLLAVLALILEMWVQLAYLGWLAPVFQMGISENDGPLLITAFLGTLIFFERANTRKQNWIFSASVLSGSGTLVLILFPGSLAGVVIIIMASLAAVVILALNLREEGHFYTITIGLGALAWLSGNLLWLRGWPLQQVIFWWAAFLILAITGERLELSRKVRRPAKFQYQLLGLSTCILLGGVTVTGQNLEVGARLAGLGVLMLATWLLCYDVARHNINNPSSLTRYTAICILVGYCWLAVVGLLSLYYNDLTSKLFYDAMFYSVFLGFVFSMIFGQAPVILQNILGLPIEFMRLFYLHLAVLHASLLLRIDGDLFSWQMGIRWGGLFNQLSILIFLGVIFFAFRRAVLKAGLAESV